MILIIINAANIGDVVSPKANIIHIKVQNHSERW